MPTLESSACLAGTSWCVSFWVCSWHEKAARRRLIVAVRLRQLTHWDQDQTLRIRVHQERLYSLQGVENRPNVPCMPELFSGNIESFPLFLPVLQPVLRKLKNGVSTLSFLHRKFFPTKFCNRCSFDIFRKAYLSPVMWPPPAQFPTLAHITGGGRRG